MCTGKIVHGIYITNYIPFVPQLYQFFFSRGFAGEICKFCPLFEPVCGCVAFHTISLMVNENSFIKICRCELLFHWVGTFNPQLKRKDYYW
jgi:hypothetical protein